MAIQSIPAESRASAGVLSLGNLADRFGAARTVAAGGLLYLAAMVMTAFATASFALTLGNVLCGIGMAAAGFRPIFPGVRRRTPPRDPKKDILVLLCALRALAFVCFSPCLCDRHPPSLFRGPLDAVASGS